MSKDWQIFIGKCMFLLIPLSVVYVTLWPFAERYLIRTEDIIAYISDFSFVFFLPMGIFVAFLINFIHRLRKLKKKENQVWDPIDKADKKQQRRWKIRFSLICICIFISCSCILCAGTLQRTVITSDYKVKNYNFAGQVSAEYEPESIRFVKIYPEAEYSRHTGFVSLHTVVEIYINENDYFSFCDFNFDSFEQLVEYKNILDENRVKVYIADNAENDPEPDDLTEDDVIYIENFYKEYEKLK